MRGRAKVGDRSARGQGGPTPNLALQRTPHRPGVLSALIVNSAVLAELVRAGIGAVDPGQHEAGEAIGLRRGQVLRLIVLPQAIRLIVPTLVTQLTTLLKDTTLVFFVGIFDFLKTIEVARADPKWATPVTSATGYIFAAAVYFVFCFAMSRYATGIEKRLSTGEKR